MQFTMLDILVLLVGTMNNLEAKDSTCTVAMLVSLILFRL